MKLDFEVAMDNEQKKAKNVKRVVIEVDMSVATRQQLEELAKKSLVISYQSQIRGNWDDFIKGNYPKEIKFGETLFASKRGGPVTVDKAKNVLTAHLAEMSPAEKIKYLISIGLLPENTPIPVEEEPEGEELENEEESEEENQ